MRKPTPVTHAETEPVFWGPGVTPPKSPVFALLFVG